jgi:hypothetical protein
MASFTDQISQFNPYVQQLPIEAMVQVGMQKQAQYDQGLQKIQGYIDNIAGIELLKDPDKANLKSKLNQLGSRLKTVAAGDFSNQQLVNSIGGMASQIVKDKDIQTAMRSTAKYKAQMARVEEDSKKTGGSNIYNKDKFYKESMAWLNDGAVGTDFTGEYFDHRNVYNKLVEIGKTVGIDSKTVQQLFKTDANGNPLMINGSLQYNDVMAETLIKGKDKQKLLEAFQAALDPADYKQLSINGEYELKGKSDKELMSLVDGSYNDYRRNNLLQKELIQDKILKIKSSGDTSDEAMAAIDQLEKSIVTLDDMLAKKRSSVVQLKSSGPDAIRGSLYTNNFIDSVSNSLSEKETYTKYTKNPAVEMLMDKERLKIAANAEARQWAEFNYRQKKDVSDRDFEMFKLKFNAGLVDENGRPTGAGGGLGAPRNRPVDDKVNPMLLQNTFDDDLNADMNAQIGLYEKVVLARQQAISGLGKTPEVLKAEMFKTAKDEGLSYNNYVVLQGKKLLTNFNNNKGKSEIGNQFNGTFQELNRLEKILLNKSAQSKARDEYVNQNMALKGEEAFDFNKVKGGPTTITTNLPTRLEGGKITGFKKQTVNLSKEDLFKFASIKSAQGFLGGIFVPKAKKEEAAKFREQLVQKFGEPQFYGISDYLRGLPENREEGSTLGDRFSSTASGLVPLFTTGAIPYSSPLKPVNRNEAMEKAVSSDNFRKTIELREQFHKTTGNIAVPLQYPVLTGNDKKEKITTSKLAGILSDFASAGIGGYEGIAQYVTDSKAQWFVNVDPSTSAYGKNTYNIQLTKPDGTIEAKPITEQHFIELSGKQPPRVNTDPIKASIGAFNTGSTNSTYSYTDKNAYLGAYVKPDDFINTNKYRVAADFAPGANGLVFPKLYIQGGSANDWRLIEYDPGRAFKGFTTQEAEEFIPKVDDVFINGLLQIQRRK